MLLLLQYYTDAVYVKELKARRDRRDERRRRDMERQQQARRLQGSAGVGAVGPGAIVASALAATAAADSNQPGFSAGADSELERLYRAAERHTQREREAAMELQRKRELKEAIANRKAAAKTFSVVHHRHPREVDREHIALLKKRFRFGSLPPPACPPRSKDLTLRPFMRTAGWRT